MGSGVLKLYWQSMTLKFPSALRESGSFHRQSLPGRIYLLLDCDLPVLRDGSLPIGTDVPRVLQTTLSLSPTAIACYLVCNKFYPHTRRQGNIPSGLCTC